MTLSTVSWPIKVVDKIMEMFTVPELNSSIQSCKSPDGIYRWHCRLWWNNSKCKYFLILMLTLCGTITDSQMLKRAQSLTRLSFKSLSSQKIKIWLTVSFILETSPKYLRRNEMYMLKFHTKELLIFNKLFLSFKTILTLNFKYFCLFYPSVLSYMVHPISEAGNRKKTEKKKRAWANLSLLQDHL